MDKGIIKKLNTSELKGWEGQEGMDVYPVTSTDAVFDGDNKSLTDILKDFSTNSTSVPATVRTKLLQVYKTATVQPVAPAGGSYSFTSKVFTAPEGWSSSAEGLDNPVWMSYGSAASNNDSITWSIPVCISGSTVSTAAVKVYVAVVYKNAVTKPDTPVGGSYDFSSKTLTPPDGWSKDSEVAVNEETWCSIGAFYSDGRDVLWSEPSKTAQANVSISAAQIEAIAGKISISANELDYIVDNIKLTASQLEYIASNMTLTSDQLKIISNSVEITGTLNTTDLTVNGSASKFNADGSGYIANGNFSWDTTGKITQNITEFAGTIKASLFYGKMDIIDGETTEYKFDPESNPVSFLYFPRLVTSNEEVSLKLPDPGNWEGLTIEGLIAGRALTRVGTTPRTVRVYAGDYTNAFQGIEGGEDSPDTDDNLNNTSYSHRLCRGYFKLIAKDSSWYLLQGSIVSDAYTGDQN